MFIPLIGTILTLPGPMAFGPVAHYVGSFENFNQSTKYSWNLINDSQKYVPPTGFWLYIDVWDLALVHILTIERQEAESQRILVTARNYSYQKVVKILREELPEIRSQVLEASPNEEFPKSGVYQGDFSKSVKILGIGYRPLKATVLDTAQNLLDIERKLKV